MGLNRDKELLERVNGPDVEGLAVVPLEDRESALNVLREIADEDYRGNRPGSSVKAHEYLESIGRRRQ